MGKGAILLSRGEILTAVKKKEQMMSLCPPTPVFLESQRNILQAPMTVNTQSVHGQGFLWSLETKLLFDKC